MTSSRPVRTCVLAVAALFVMAAPLPAQQPLAAPALATQRLSLFVADVGLEAAPSSRIVGAAYARGFSLRESGVDVAVAVSGGGRRYDDPSRADIASLGWTASASRALSEVRPGLIGSVSVGGRTLLRGTDLFERGGAYVIVPITAGIGHEVRVGGAVLTPYVAPTLAWYRSGEYDRETRTRVEDSAGLDPYITTGASLRVGRMVLNAAGTSGEREFGGRHRWVLSAGF